MNPLSLNFNNTSGKVIFSYMKSKYFVSLCVTFMLLSDYKFLYHKGHKVKRGELKGIY